jgi:hypothetical protein
LFGNPDNSIEGFEMRKTGNKKLFLCLTALAAFVLCGIILSCLQTVYDTGLLDYAPSTTPVDIKSTFYAADGSTILIVKLRNGAFKTALAAGEFLLDGNVVNGAPVRDSDTRVMIRISSLSAGSHQLTVKSNALLSPATRVSVQAVTSGWFPVDSDTVNNIFGNAQIWGIGYGDGKFVAAGAGGRIASYSAGTWTAVLPGTSAGQSGFWDTDTIRAVAYGNGKFVAVGYGAKMSVSANGTDWSGWTEFAFNGESILAIVYGNGKFVAAGDKGRIRYSSSGDSGTWSNAQGTAFGETAILGLACGQTSSAYRFIAVGNEGKIAWSDDGVTWTAATAGFGSDAINAVTFGGPSAGKKFVAVGDEGKIAYSADGKTWTVAPIIELPSVVFEGKGILSVCYGSGKFVAAGHNGKMAKLDDTETAWDPVTSGHFSVKVGTDDGDAIRAIAYGGGMFIAGGNRYEYPYDDNRTYAEQTTAKMVYGY